MLIQIFRIRLTVETITLFFLINNISPIIRL